MTREKLHELDLSRRSVLRKSAAATVAVGVGVPAFSGTALASACPRTPGYWMNHDWPSSGLMNVNENFSSFGEGDFFDRVEEGQEFLRKPPRGDKGRIMAFHLIATILNFQLTGDCYDVDTGVVDVTGDGEKETFSEIKGFAQKWLRLSSFPDSQRRWTVNSTNAPVKDGEVLKDLLDQFNNDNLLECDCAVDD